MRTFADRIRHTLLFELLALLISAPIASWITGHEVTTIGALAVILSALAMSWNLIYNWLFDLLENRLSVSGQRSLKTRILHAIGFEAGLLIPGLFIVVWWLQISLWQAFVMDIGFMLFFLVYALVFNWSYDKAFPVPAPTGAAAISGTNL